VVGGGVGPDGLKKAGTVQANTSVIRTTRVILFMFSPLFVRLFKQPVSKFIVKPCDQQIHWGGPDNCRDFTAWGRLNA